MWSVAFVDPAESDLRGARGFSRPAKILVKPGEDPKREAESLFRATDAGTRIVLLLLLACAGAAWWVGTTPWRPGPA